MADDHAPFDPEIRYPNITAHKLVAEVALAMAQEVYETLCSGSDALYKIHGDRNDAIRQWAPMLRKAARAQLAEMLGNPSISDREKAEIYDALMMDHILPEGLSLVRH